jgi:hypothetical protein
MRVVKFLSATLLGCGLLAQTAGASPMPCMLHDDLVKLLDTKYQEELNGYGIAGQRNLVEVFFSAKGSFTVVATNAKGLSCIIAAGHSWEKVTPPQKLTGL